jgi:hypothetical protein
MGHAPHRESPTASVELQTPAHQWADTIRSADVSDGKTISLKPVLTPNSPESFLKQVAANLKLTIQVFHPDNTNPFFIFERKRVTAYQTPDKSNSVSGTVTSEVV